jgi:pimeloyl-ACP methyl ester carboxylesterase
MAQVAFGQVRTVLPDMRGFGASDKPREQAAYETKAMSRDVAAPIDHLCLGAVGVIGFSVRSGTAARPLMLRSPEVKSAILAGVGDYAIEETAEAYVKIRSSYSPSPCGSLASSHAVSRRRGSAHRGACTARYDRRASSAQSYSEHAAP